MRACNRRGGVVVSRFASQPVEVSLISLQVIPRQALKIIFTAFLLGTLYENDSGKKPACVVVGFLGKALNGYSPSSCGRNIVRPSSLPVELSQYNKRLAKRSLAHVNFLLRTCFMTEKYMDLKQHMFSKLFTTANLTF